MPVIVYMTSWCPDCSRSRRLLQQSNVEFVEIDLDAIAGAEESMRAHNGGSGKVPTILIDSVEGRIVLIEPSDKELAEALQKLPAAVGQ